MQQQAWACQALLCGAAAACPPLWPPCPLTSTGHLVREVPWWDKTWRAVTQLPGLGGVPSVLSRDKPPPAPPPTQTSSLYSGLFVCFFLSWHTKQKLLWGLLRRRQVLRGRAVMTEARCPKVSDWVSPQGSRTGNMGRGYVCVHVLGPMLQEFVPLPPMASSVFFTCTVTSVSAEKWHMGSHASELTSATPDKLYVLKPCGRCSIYWFLIPCAFSDGAYYGAALHKQFLSRHFQFGELFCILSLV